MLFLLTATLKADQHAPQPRLPQLDNGYAWQNMPMICAGDNQILENLTEQGFTAINMSLGREGADPKGEALFLITYFVNQDMTSTAATMNIPTSTDTCLIFLTHDLVINQAQ